MKTALVIILTLAAGSAFADPRYQPDQKFYDSRGNHVGTVARDSAGNTVEYNSRGNVVGRTSTDSSGRTNFYDAGGNHVGTSYRERDYLGSRR